MPNDVLLGDGDERGDDDRADDRADDRVDDRADDRAEGRGEGRGADDRGEGRSLGAGAAEPRRRAGAPAGRGGEATSATGHDAAGAAVYSVGQVAQLTGLSPDTLRVWERRYGRPVPLRLASGHRRYTRAQVRWLTRVVEAIALGFRPSTVVRAGEDELDELLRDGQHRAADDADVLRWLTLVRAFDEHALADSLQASLQREQLTEFLEHKLAVLMTCVGREWADGGLDVRHEHFATEIVEDTCRGARAHLLRRRGVEARPILLATPPGERHGLALQLVATVCAAEGVGARVLGTELAAEQIAAAVDETATAAVGLSISLANGGARGERAAAELRALLPERVELLVGGAGAPGARRRLAGVQRFSELSTFRDWLRERFGPGSGAGRDG